MADNYPNIPYIGFKDENLKTPITFPAQHQNFQPGLEYEMKPLPIFDNPNYKPSQKLQGKVAIISGGDSGIGRAVSLLFAKEGADIVIMNDDLNKIPKVLQIAKKTRAILWQNIIFALGVKVGIMILGAFGATNLWIALFGDVGVAILALLNAIRAIR